MKKNTYLSLSFAYMIAGLAMGVFYREFTKWSGYAGVTSLGFVHSHLIGLGMLFYLILYFALRNDPLQEDWKKKTFLWTYNIGLAGMTLMMAVRGILQVEALSLSKGLEAMVSGIAGAFHLTLAVGLVFFFLCLFEKEKLRKNAVH
jgi:hypothetical protein